VELNISAEEIMTMRQVLVQHGAWLRPFGNTLYFMPPLTITTTELDVLMQASLKAVKGLSA
jgi:adenosylmethionine---8-amino-7-oxononanoate aminotransferase